MMKQRNVEDYIMRSLQFVFPPPFVILVIKSRRMRWAGHVARTRGFVWGNLRERDILEDLGCGWKNNIKIDLQKME